MDVKEELIVIGNWAKSCETKEQLVTVKKFLDKKLFSKQFIFTNRNSDEAHLHLGIVSGIILTLFKTKFA